MGEGQERLPRQHGEDQEREAVANERFLVS